MVTERKKQQDRERMQKKREEAKTKNKQLYDALASAHSWLDKYGKHVGSCFGNRICTCGLDAIRNEILMVMQDEEN